MFKSTPITVFFLLLTFICFLLNIDAPKLVSEAPFIQLLLDYILLILGSKNLVNKVLCQYSPCIRKTFWDYFLLSLSISLFFLWFMWTPMLNPSLPDWGFDPLRYYYYATEIIRTGFMAYALSYLGVVYYNVTIMEVFGMDPLVPLFTNAFLTLYAVLLLTRFINDTKHIKKYALLLLIPEIISFNMMASREIICAALVTVFAIKFQEILNKATIARVLILVLSFLLVAFVRPPMAGVAIISIFIYMLFVQKRKLIKSVFLIVIAFVVLAVGFAMSTSLGSHFTSDSLSESVSEQVEGDNQERQDAKSGLTTMLIPHTPVEYVVFGFIRSFAYVVPAPIMVKDFFNQFSLSNYTIYEHLTTVLLFILFPIVLRGVMKHKKFDNNVKYIMTLLLCYFFTIGISLPNLIHNRYRLVYDLFYFAFGLYCWYNRKRLWGTKVQVTKANIEK